jgi:hypothetical protein
LDENVQAANDFDSPHNDIGSQNSDMDDMNIVDVELVHLVRRRSKEE